MGSRRKNPTESEAILTIKRVNSSKNVQVSKTSVDPDFAIRLQDLDHLVGELTCANPKLEALKDQMNRLGIEYSEDPTERMSRVLFLIQKIQFDFSQDLPEFRPITEMKRSQTSRNKKVSKDGIEI